MKKLVAMALSLTLAVSMLTACGGGAPGMAENYRKGEQNDTGTV